MRQLGSIYEGLLEFKLRIADRKLAIVKGKGREVYAPFHELNERERERAERQGRVVRKGQVYLENDKRERKATGSYYTPDPIVKYIVEHTVGPVLQEKFDAMRPRLREAQQRRRAFFQKQEALRKQGLLPEPEGKADLIGQELVGEIFDLKVLDPARLSPQDRRIGEIALAAAAGKRFFHWELEFPEVFYGPRPGTQQAIERLEGAGFDAVIGNSPYVRQEELGDLKVYLQAQFPNVYNGVADVYFYGRGYGVLRNGGRFGMITSNKFMRSNYGGPLRKFLAEAAAIKEIVDFGELPVFPEAATFPCIFLFSKGTRADPPRFTQVKDLSFESLNEVVMESGIPLGGDALNITAQSRHI